MISLSSLRRFLRFYIYKLNYGSSPAVNFITEEEYIKSYNSTPEKEKRIINLVLFLVTFCTTTLAGSVPADTLVESLAGGLPYSVTLMSILAVHEMGHYFAARRFNVRASLPYFIPFPSIVGTMGAVIKTKSPIPHRRALFYIGVMGPLPGFVLSLGAVISGMALSEVQPLPPADGMTPIFGDSLLFGFIVNIVHGHIPAGYDIVLHPFAWAGWIGFLVTSLNLMPVGQLDGGHILYSLIGRRQVYVGWLVLVLLVPLAFIWPGWGFWVFLTLFVLMVGHPKVPEGCELTSGEKALGWFCMAILVVTFIPVPVQLY